jgi:hypothetical protein
MLPSEKSGRVTRNYGTGASRAKNPFRRIPGSVKKSSADAKGSPASTQFSHHTLIDSSPRKRQIPPHPGQRGGAAVTSGGSGWLAGLSAGPHGTAVIRPADLSHQSTQLGFRHAVIGACHLLEPPSIEHDEATAIRAKPPALFKRAQRNRYARAAHTQHQRKKFVRERYLVGVEDGRGPSIPILPNAPRRSRDRSRSRCGPSAP